MLEFLILRGTLASVVENRYEVIVVGAGQAGIEAALAASRMGLKTLCVTLRLDRIGHLPCNCSIGGPAKGHLAREVDALGGEMAVTTDHTLTHIRRVGTSKGPAVQTVRAQVCKTLYPERMREVLEAQPGLTLLSGTVETVLTDRGRVSGVVVDGETFLAPAVVLTTGTFLNGICHEGTNKTSAARHGEPAVAGLSAFLSGLGVNLRRFKTGTTPRVAKSSLNLDRTEPMPSEPDAGPVSFLHDAPLVSRELYPCWQTRTGPATHAVLQENLHRSAMFSGQIQGVGPRYCPSVEDKIVRFAEKDSHPIFLEQEEWDSESIYVQGFSTSLPAEVQLAALRTIPGMESVEMMRPGYAVEYDMADPLQLEPTLMSRLLPGLFLAGQLNGTSGYEEAAAQGLVAGLNAALFARGEEAVTFSRTESFLGVMIDDLVTKGVEDPYRMLTARAEHRLLLRHDNADLRLTPIAVRYGIASTERKLRHEAKIQAIRAGTEWLKGLTVSSRQNEALEAMGQAPLSAKVTLFELMRRPEFGLDQAEELCHRLGWETPSLSDPRVREQLDLDTTFEGYIQIQARHAEHTRQMEAQPIPEGFDWHAVRGLSYESREKLGRMQPRSVGQAARIPGVRPADISLLVGHLRYYRQPTQDPLIPAEPEPV